MRNNILILLIVAASLLTTGALIFAIMVFTKRPSGLERSVSIVALIAAVTALITSISVYRRLTRSRPPG